jgi:hypothetical protein
MVKKTIHFKRNENSRTGCGKLNNDSANINWDKVNCTECLMLKKFLKDKRK